MAEAIFGLIGVLVGGVLNFVTVIYLQGRKDKSALRSVARLAYDDCLHFQSTIVRALAGERWWPVDEVTPFQVRGKTRQFLFGALQDGSSQDVAAALGWADYIVARRRNAAGDTPSQAELLMLRDTFCRLDAARWQLSRKVSGREFRSFVDGAVLTTLDDPTTTLEELQICDADCRERRALNYGRGGAR